MTSWMDRKPAKVKRAQPELILHIQVADFLKRALPADVAWTTFPAGGGGKIRGADLKAMGLHSGWPDIQLIHPKTGVFHTIELKSEKGRLSPDQKAVHAAIRASGGHVEIARSVDEVEGILRGWGFSLIATLGARAA